MIIQLRATSGGGKSHIVRQYAHLEVIPGCERSKVRVAGRKQPIGYFIRRPDGRNLAIPGHYETACGGCDTIPDLTKVFETVRQSASVADDVLFEGLLASEDSRRTIELHNAFPGQVRVILIDTPIEECLAGIQARRDARGDTHPLKPDNTTNRVKTIRRACDKLREAGVYVAITDRVGAAGLVREWLK